MIEYISERRCFLMAKKGQKFSKYTDELKVKVMSKVKEGVSFSHLSKEYKIPLGTIATWTRKKNHPELNTGNKQGRPKAKDLTKEDYKERYEILKKYQAFLKEQRERK